MGCLRGRRTEVATQGLKRIQGQCNGTRLVVVTRGAIAETAGPTFNFNQPFEEEQHVAHL